MGFEKNSGLQTLSEILDVIKSRLECSLLDKAGGSLGLYGELPGALQLLEKIRNGYGIVWIASVCSVLENPRVRTTCDP